MALWKTAETAKEEFPQAADVILRNSYVDDIADSVKDIQTAVTITNEVDSIVKQGGFEIKQWFFTSVSFCNNTAMSDQSKPDASFSLQESNMFGDIFSSHQPLDSAAGNCQKILGFKWDPKDDEFRFEVHVNFSLKRGKLRTGPDLCLENIPSEVPVAFTKRMVLSQVNGTYDPLGFASPFTVKAKILMRKLWSGNARSLGCDDPMPATYRDEWIQFFREVFQMKEIAFTRCIRPMEAVGDPTLVVFSDSSADAFGACSYIRWELDNGSFHSSLIVSKYQITPLHKITTVRSELSAAVIAKRIRNLLKRECRLKYSKENFIVDSEIIRAMIQKDSYVFNTFVALHIGEIQEATNPSDWYWIDGKLNISDWLTRGKSPRELGEDSLTERSRFSKIA